MKYFLLACGVVLIITAFAISKQKPEKTPLREETSVSTSVPSSSTQSIDLPHFFLACQQGKTELIKEFLKQNNSIDITDKNGYTCLMMAAYTDRVDTVSFLIQQKANLAARSNKGINALQLAIRGNSLSTVDLLLNNGAPIERSPLLCRQAWQEGHEDLYYLLRDRDICEISVDKQSPDKQVSNSKEKSFKQKNTPSTSLVKQNTTAGISVSREYEATSSGPLEESKAFIGGKWSGDNLSAQDINDALCFEALYPSMRSKERIKILLQKGANPNCYCKDFFEEGSSSERKRVISVAVQHGNAEALQMLIDAGADVHTVDNKQRTLLIETCKYALPQTIQLALAEILLKTDLDINAKDSYNMTALGYVEDDKKMLRDLLTRHGAKGSAQLR